MSSESTHPFLEGLSRHRGAPATLLVIFGASGDLTSRKLVPALYNLAVDNLLPGRFNFIGFGRTDIPDEDFRARCKQDIGEFSRRPLQDDVWNDLSGKIEYFAGKYDDPDAFNDLNNRLQALEMESGEPLQFVFYISTPPGVFENIIENLGHCGLARHQIDSRLSTKVIIEKPFGHDLESARELNHIIGKHFDEQQVYRIDHYLGKETVQNLLVQRFANAIFEPIWNRSYVDHVAITVAESVGVGSRAGYYDRSGALRDMIQNHTMQLLSLVAMEPPASLDPEAIRDEKVKVLQAVAPLKLDNGCSDAVRGRYSEGRVEGSSVPGYMQEENVPEDSFTETYAALRLNINNWRWSGVPFYLRSGKRLPRRVSEIAIQFKRPPGVLFSSDKSLQLAANTLVIQVQPDEGMSLVMNSKIPGLETRTQPVKMHFRYATTFGSNTPEAYERLIIDAMVGDSTLFIRGDETEASWKLVDPVLNYWQEQGIEGLEEYPAGSWGPAGAGLLLQSDGNEWRRS